MLFAMGSIKMSLLPISCMSYYIFKQRLISRARPGIAIYQCILGRIKVKSFGGNQSRMYFFKYLLHTVYSMQLNKFTQILKLNVKLTAIESENYLACIVGY